MKKLIIATMALSLLCAASLSAKPVEIRGIKGLWWQGIDKYNKALPWLAEHKLNFLMLCYSSFPASGQDWRSQYTSEEQDQFRNLAAQGNKLGVNVCLSFNPGIWSKPQLVYSSDRDYEIAIDKIRTVHALGINWFGLCLDDINRGLDPADQTKFANLQAAQVYFVNRLWRAMKTMSPRPKLIFCPSAYTTEDMKAHLDYIKTIGEGIDKDVMLFWTGPECCSSSINAADANEAAKLLKRKPFVWDNYPVNDMFPWRPLMSPLKNRSADLRGAISGYISNPMKQLYTSEIVLSTTAAYLNDPDHYDPTKAMDAAINSYPADQQPALRLLVELYGSTFWGEKGFPPKPGSERPEQAAQMVQKYRALRHMLSTNPALANLWEDVAPTLNIDIATLDRIAAKGKRANGLAADGLDFSGGAGDVYGFYKEDRWVNYVYAKPTGKSEMSTTFQITQLPSSAKLRIVARNADTADMAHVSILLNDQAVVNNEVVFTNKGLTERTFDMPAGALKTGTNTLLIRNEENQGTMGSPPWFMIAEAEIVPD